MRLRQPCDLEVDANIRQNATVEILTALQAMEQRYDIESRPNCLSDLSDSSATRDVAVCAATIPSLIMRRLNDRVETSSANRSREVALG